MCTLSSFFATGYYHSPGLSETMAHVIDWTFQGNGGVLSERFDDPALSQPAAS